MTVNQLISLLRTIVIEDDMMGGCEVMVQVSGGPVFEATSVIFEDGMVFIQADEESED